MGAEQFAVAIILLVLSTQFPLLAARSSSMLQDEDRDESHHHRHHQAGQVNDSGGGGGGSNKEDMVIRPKSSSVVPICKQQVDSGICKAYMPRYYFNTANNKCERFIYGGCGGNRNNFRTIKECIHICGSEITADEKQLFNMIMASNYHHQERHRDVFDVFETLMTGPASSVASAPAPDDKPTVISSGDNDNCKGDDDDDHGNKKCQDEKTLISASNMQQ